MGCHNQKINKSTLLNNIYRGDHKAYSYDISSNMKLYVYHPL